MRLHEIVKHATNGTAVLGQELVIETKSVKPGKVVAQVIIVRRWDGRYAFEVWVYQHTGPGNGCQTRHDLSRQFWTLHEAYEHVSALKEELSTVKEVEPCTSLVSEVLPDGGHTLLGGWYRKDGEWLFRAEGEPYE